ncbi:hypothetical protein [Streptomyces sp. NBC_00386]|uniref:hypothetical protein n=1 Tax=Streptomyces sp. NBC_00386 TaxID=2975734 RepID=UPI003FCDA9D8
MPSPVPRRVILGALGAAALSVVPHPPSAAASAVAVYTLLSRAAWGADGTLRYADGTEIWPPEYYPVQTLTVHHTDDGSSDPDPAAVVQAIYRNDTVGKGYGDIGYHGPARLGTHRQPPAREHRPAHPDPGRCGAPAPPRPGPLQPPAEQLTAQRHRYGAPASAWRHLRP